MSRGRSVRAAVTSTTSSPATVPTCSPSVPRKVTSLTAFSFELGGDAARSGCHARPSGALRRIRPMPDATAVCVTVDHLRGPGDDRMLDVLDRHGIRTTFFVEGEHGASHPGRVAELVARGHEVGLHGWAHEAWAELDRASVHELLARGADALAAAAG